MLRQVCVEGLTPCNNNLASRKYVHRLHEQTVNAFTAMWCCCWVGSVYGCPDKIVTFIAVVMTLRRVMGLLMLPLRVVGQCLGSLLSSQRISEDVLGVSSPQALSLVGRPCAGFCRLSGFLCWSGVCTEEQLSANSIDVELICNPNL